MTGSFWNTVSIYKLMQNIPANPRLLVNNCPPWICALNIRLVKVQRSPWIFFGMSRFRSPKSVQIPIQIWDGRRLLEAESPDIMGGVCWQWKPLKKWLLEEQVNHGLEPWASISKLWHPWVAFASWCHFEVRWFRGDSKLFRWSWLATRRRNRCSILQDQGQYGQWERSRTF